MKLPTDKEAEKWYSENITENTSPSTAIYKFRIWLKLLNPELPVNSREDAADILENEINKLGSEAWRDFKGFYNVDKRFFPATLRAMEEYASQSPAWVSVKEEKPEFGKCVLIVLGNGMITTGYRVNNPGNITWFIYNDNLRDEDVLGITHWMPLPSPPTE